MMLQSLGYFKGNETLVAVKSVKGPNGELGDSIPA